MSRNEKTPPVSAALIEYLERLFPNQLPTDAVTLETLRVLQGQQMVVRKLKSVFEEQITQHIQPP